MTFAAALAVTACAGGVDGGAAAAPVVAQPVGDAARGAAIAASRTQGLCVLCHPLPGVPDVLAGNLGPSLAGVGARYARDELRQRIVEPRRYNPETIMPSAARRDGFARVAPQRRGQPLLDAQQIEDVVAYLATLR